MELQYLEEAKVKSEIHITIYEPINDMIETHKPVITFIGDVLRMKALEQIGLAMKKGLRRYKMEVGKTLIEERENQEEGDKSDGTE